MTRHLYMNCSIDGTPEIDLKAGTVSGLKVVTDQYTRLQQQTTPEGGLLFNNVNGQFVPALPGCCDRIVGGRITLRQNGNTFELTGDVKIRPSNIERTSEATNDGRLMTMIKPRLPDAEITFANFCDGDPLDLFNQACKTSVTIEELDR